MLKRLDPIEYSTLLHSILSEYHEKHDLTKVPIKVDFLKPIMERKGIVDVIELYEVEFSADHIAATVEIFDRPTQAIAKIKVASSLDDYWRRIAICKEMYHCVIDRTEKLRVTSVNDLLDLKDALVSPIYPHRSKQLTPDLGPFDTESDAELLAVETLFPYELRRTHIEGYYQGKPTATNLAMRYVIPEYYIPLAMQKKHLELIRKFRAEKLVKI